VDAEWFIRRELEENSRIIMGEIPVMLKEKITEFIKSFQTWSIKVVFVF
jgi:hypothetical protein